MARSQPLVIADQRIGRGVTRDLHLTISETYLGDAVEVPIRVMRARRSGPTVFITGGVHGDELNGTGIIRELMFDQPPRLTRGTIICVPVINIFGFEGHQRYLPDRRDLNRSFPGSATGSLAARVADAVMQNIIGVSNFGIDLHSAAKHRTNFPNVRADMRSKACGEIARAFGCELVVHGNGPEGSLRRAASDAGCPTIILEAGEVDKVEPAVLEVGLRGIRNVLIHLDMLDGEREEPVFQTVIRRTTWIRASLGGLLRFHVAPGDVVEAGQPIATNVSFFGEARSVVISPEAGIVLGMTTYPAVKPGEPICHLAKATGLRSIRRKLDAASDEVAHHRTREHLATSISVTSIDEG